MALIGEWAARFATDAEERYPVTTEAMIKHLDRHGLDNANEKGYRGKPVHYKTYKQLREDAWVHVARSRFREETYAQLVSLVGYAQFEEEARADWKDMRREQA